LYFQFVFNIDEVADKEKWTFLVEATILLAILQRKLAFLANFFVKKIASVVNRRSFKNIKLAVLVLLDGSKRYDIHTNIKFAPTHK
jgi:hypothetical protein